MINSRTSFVVSLLVLFGGISGQSVFAAGIAASQSPLYLQQALPPLNMLVMGRDHKLYAEAYNDAADLDADGIVDVGYRPADVTDASGNVVLKAIEYYGYFNSRVCYTYSSTNKRFEPSSAGSGTNGRECSGKWSGDFLNYVTTSRMDALRKVLYGGKRAIDTNDRTVLQAAYIPQDAHSWGKEYRGAAVDGYDISKYTPLSAPADGKYHLFAVTTLSDNGAPQLRVLTDTVYRIWEWVSVEAPVAGTKCLNGSARTDCVGAGTETAHPGHPASEAEFDTMEANYAIDANRFSTRTLSTLNCSSNNCNPDGTDDNYLTIATMTLRFEDDADANGNYRFCINGDDAIDFEIFDSTGAPVGQVGWYSNHGFASNCSSHSTGDITLQRNKTYTIKLRHEEASGGDGYQLQWSKVSGGQTFGFRELKQNDGDSKVKDIVDESASTGFSASFYDLTPLSSSGGAMTDYQLQVEVCPESSTLATLRESNCQKYLDGSLENWKPTGILHDYGADDQMYFGLLSGSQLNNLEGGVLRQNIDSFAREVNASTGIFTAVEGIRYTLDALRPISFNYSGHQWTYSGSSCPALGYRQINNGECRMWGNPIGEMMLETLRYFAGATSPTSAFATAANTNGTSEETALDLPAPTWKDPYKTVANGGLGFKSCAKPVMTVISDINPSFDGNVPGAPGTWDQLTYSMPATIDDFNMATQAQAIWDAELGSGTKQVFIGETADSADGAPSPKDATTLGTIRGMPEEPTYRGSYSSAAVAAFGWTGIDGINALSDQKVRTYSVALASPLPLIDFRLTGGRRITLLPFSKTVARPGASASGSTSDLRVPQNVEYRPTSAIVDFYVEDFANLPGARTDLTVNGGLGYARFRINYESMEQGNDYDMDAIATYTVEETVDGNVNVRISSDYQATGGIHHMGYVISGTTKDGVYLEVRTNNSRDVGTSLYLRNPLDTPIYPDGTMKWAGECDTASPSTSCPTFTENSTTQLLPLTSDRTFTPSSTASVATALNSPLWYAAKYGSFSDSNNNKKPDLPIEWDEDGNGTPDRYFLVTNALTLKEQLAKAFDQIERDSKPTGGVAASGARKDGELLAYVPEYNAGDWTGDVKAYPLTETGGLGDLAWSANEELPAPADRKLYALKLDKTDGTGTTSKTNFTVTDLGGDAAALAYLGYADGELAAIFGATNTPTVTDVVNYLRGVTTKEISSGGVFRNRSSLIGDILGSQPEVLSRGSFGYSRLKVNGSAYTAIAEAYTTFVQGTKLTRTPAIFVGANDGMLHAFDGSNGTTGGQELFAVIPDSVRTGLKELTRSSYAHRFYVDASPTQGDAYLGSWKTILLASTGLGGNSVMALDVTNPATFSASNIMWEFRHPDLGQSIGRSRVILAEDDQWYALIPNGLNSVGTSNADGTNPTGHQASLFLVRLSDSKVFTEINTGEGSAADPNGMSSVAALDTDGDFKVDTVYGGDYHGNVWKFNLSSANSAEWNVAFSGEPLFTATYPGSPAVRQHITGSIDVARHNSQGYMVYVGTGRYLIDGTDNVPANSNEIQSMYGLWDRHTSTEVPITRDKLQQQKLTGEVSGTRTSTSEPVNYSGDENTQRGWYMDLAVYTENVATAAAERIIGSPRVVLGKVLVTTFTPVGNECQPGGVNRLCSLDALSGSAGLTLDAITVDKACTTLTTAGTSDAPALTPPIVTSPPKLPDEHDPKPCEETNTCPEIPDEPCEGADCPEPEPAPCVGADCDDDGDGDVEPDPDNPGGVEKPVSECRVSVGVLLHSGLKEFATLSCGRVGWRQVR